MKDDARFEIVRKETVSFARAAIILRDTQTSVLYLFMESGNAGGLTPLLDREGKPISDPYMTKD